MKMSGKVKDILKYTLSLGLAALLVWFAVRSVDWKAFLDGLKMTRWIWLIPFLAASVGALVFRAFRWQALLKSCGYRTPWLTVWDANNVGNLPTWPFRGPENSCAVATWPEKPAMQACWGLP